MRENAGFRRKSLSNEMSQRRMPGTGAGEEDRERDAAREGVRFRYRGRRSEIGGRRTRNDGRRTRRGRERRERRGRGLQPGNDQYYSYGKFPREYRRWVEEYPEIERSRFARMTKNLALAEG